MNNNNKNIKNTLQKAKYLKSVGSQILAFLIMSEASTIKGVYRNFAKFTGKHLCQSLFCRLK